LFAQGYASGLVVDGGEETIHMVPVVQGRVNPEEVLRLSCGGKQLTDHLAALLTGTQAAAGVLVGRM
jgi:actin-related protein